MANPASLSLLAQLMAYVRRFVPAFLVSRVLCAPACQGSAHLSVCPV
jgi:hypothetical protein